MGFETIILKQNLNTYANAYSKINSIEIDPNSKILKVGLFWYASQKESYSQARIIRVDEIEFTHLTEINYDMILNRWTQDDLLRSQIYDRIQEIYNDEGIIALSLKQNQLVSSGLEVPYRTLIIEETWNPAELDWIAKGGSYVFDPSPANLILAESSFIVLRNVIDEFNDVIYGDRGQFIRCEAGKGGELVCEPRRWSNNFEDAILQIQPPKKSAK